MKIPIATLAYCCGVIGWAQVADAQAPVAIVEEIVSKTAGIEFMDYLRLGQSIRLGESDRLVIGYFNSCWREVIIGGTVLVGKEDSEVTGGTVERRKVRCDTGKRGGTTKETAGSGAMVFRKIPSAARVIPHGLCFIAGFCRVRRRQSRHRAPRQPRSSHHHTGPTSKCIVWRVCRSCQQQRRFERRGRLSRQSGSTAKSHSKLILRRRPARSRSSVGFCGCSPP